MEKTNPSCPLAVTGEEEEEINLQYQEIWYGETLNLEDFNSRRLDLLEKLKKTMNSHSLRPPARRRRGREGDQAVLEAGDAGGGARLQAAG